MPFAPPVTAVLNALTISLTLLFSEPVHWYEQPSSLQASSAPYFVGTKNELVVTWLTKTNFSFESDGPKTVEPPPPPLVCALAFVVVFLLSEPPQAARIVAARPAAPPVRAARR